MTAREDDCDYPNCGATAVRRVANRDLCAVHADYVVQREEYENFLLVQREEYENFIHENFIRPTVTIQGVTIQGDRLERPDEIRAAATVIARHIFARAVSDERVVAWEDYPDIAETYWEKVMEIATELAPYPDAEEYRRAYKLLSADDA